MQQQIFVSLHGDATSRKMLIMLSTTLVAVFYCLDALYGERRDRSILFWRSLPVSDTVAVLTKASIPIVGILPLLTFVIAIAVDAVDCFGDRCGDRFSGGHGRLAWIGAGPGRPRSEDAG